MNETIQTMLSRRSIRKYTDEKIAQQDLDVILECGLHAPSGGNHQEVRFTVIERQSVLDDLAAIVYDTFRSMQIVEGQYWNKAIVKAQNDPNYNFAFHAPLLIVVTAPKEWPNGMADSANALQNMHLAAVSLGLGACWVNQLHWLTDHDALRKYLLQYGIGEEEEIYGSMVFGHPDAPIPPALPRKANRIAYIK